MFFIEVWKPCGSSRTKQKQTKKEGSEGWAEGLPLYQLLFRAGHCCEERNAGLEKSRMETQQKKQAEINVK